MKACVLWSGVALCYVLALAGCSHPYFSQHYGEHVKRVMLTAADTTAPGLSFQEAQDKWMVRLSIPDPLVSRGSPDRAGQGSGRAPMTRIWATLYDQEVIDAWVRQRSEKDSVSFEEAARDYAELHRPGEQFRIELKAESGFAPESLDPGLWTLYLEDEEGIMYEPSTIHKSPVSTKERHIYSEYHDITRTRHTYRRNVDLYFPRIAFFGKELLGPNTRLLKLVFSHQQETIGEAVWIFEAPPGSP